MSVFLISYDLIDQKNYPVLWDALKDQGAHRMLDSVWLLSADNTAQEIVKWLSGYIDSDDKLVVTKLRKGEYWYRNVKAGTNAWLEEQLVS